MIELYEAYADYHDIMDLTESMVRLLKKYLVLQKFNTMKRKLI